MQYEIGHDHDLAAIRAELAALEAKHLVDDADFEAWESEIGGDS